MAKRRKRGSRAESTPHATAPDDLGDHEQEPVREQLKREEEGPHETRKRPKRVFKRAEGFLAAWTWKREHRPNKVLYERPYKHRVVDSEGRSQELVVQQAPFTAEGFASTVWDSSIVVAKYVERHRERFSGRRCLDLSAGCGLVGLVLACIGAEVTATDLAPNLPLLQANFSTNGLQGRVCAHRWGEDVEALGPPFDYVFACDVMYLEAAVEPLLATLRGTLAPRGGAALLAYGRNRHAEAAFLRRVSDDGVLDAGAVPAAELDPVYQTEDVAVLSLRFREGSERKGSPGTPGSRDPLPAALPQSPSRMC